ncbi:MAG: radical SAM protein [Desulfuromonadaceae bacterium]|nr:radical SAM protein [Desulfuromonadaceae bacterium]
MLKDRSPIIDQTGIVRLDFPAEIAIETHAYCNLRCVICPYPSMERTKGKMSIELFRKIVDEVAVTSPDTRLWVAIMGEPMLDKNIMDHLRYAVEHGAPRVHVNTNGVLMSEQKSQDLINVGVEAVYVAIDAVTRETYDIVRPGGCFDDVVRNVEKFVELREKHSGKVPELSVQFVVMDENEHELEKFVEFWHKRGVIVKLRLRQGWGRSISASDLDRVEIKRFPCPWLIRTMNVHWTGDVTQCDVDYEQRYPAGNLNKQSIQEVWMGELAQRRERQWNGDYSFPLCKDCMDWAAGRADFLYTQELTQEPRTRYSVGDNREQRVQFVKAR